MQSMISNNYIASLSTTTIYYTIVNTDQSVLDVQGYSFVHYKATFET